MGWFKRGLWLSAWGVWVWLLVSLHVAEPFAPGQSGILDLRTGRVRAVMPISEI